MCQDHVSEKWHAQLHGELDEIAATHVTEMIFGKFDDVYE